MIKRPVSPTTKRIASNRADPRRTGVRRAGRETKESNALRNSIIGFVILVIIGLGIRLIGKSSDSNDIRQQMHDIIKQSAAYSGNESYIDAKIDEHHAEVFDHAYRMAGRHSSSKFNADEYIREMLSVISEDAKRDGKNLLAKELSDN